MGAGQFTNRKLTGLSSEEGYLATFAGNAPWPLEDRLPLAGARYELEPAWTPHVFVDGNLVTGQQQKSAKVTAGAVLKQLQRAA